MADRRIQYLVEQGLMPCIVGCWGYFLPLLGIEKMKQHWRNLVARYGAYPVAWCLAGEWDMPYYLAEDKEQAAAQQQDGWAEVAQYVRHIDGFQRPVSIHEGRRGRELGDGTLVDFSMLQTGHGDRESLPNTVQRVTGEYAETPAMPVINSEVCYEGIGEACRQEVQRMMFWTCLLSGAAGHTYGANGIWQVNTRTTPFGPSPHGMAWGNTPWEDAVSAPGLRAGGPGETHPGALSLVALRAAPGMGRAALERGEFLRRLCRRHPGRSARHLFPGVLVLRRQSRRYRTRRRLTTPCLINPVNGDELDLGPRVAECGRRL